MGRSTNNINVIQNYIYIKKYFPLQIFINFLYFEATLKFLEEFTLEELNAPLI